MYEDPLIGTKINSYQIIEVLGEGAFGKVYKALHPTIKRYAAVKILHTERSLSPVVVQRFISEAQAVNQIDHPNIVSVFDFGQLPDGRYFFIMEFLDGVSLRNYILNNHPLSSDKILEIVSGITYGLDAAHSKGIIHRDLKPDNIIVTESSGRLGIKILDFGIAKLTEKSDGMSMTMTKSGQILGTPAYMSPEQARGEIHKISPASDIYSFAVIVYEIFSGILPFKSNSTADLLVKLLTEPPLPLHEYAPFVSPVTEFVINKGLAKQPEDRYQKASDFFKDLEFSIFNPRVPASSLPIFSMTDKEKQEVSSNYDSYSNPYSSTEPANQPTVPAPDYVSTQNSSLNSSAPRTAVSTISNQAGAATTVSISKPRSRFAFYVLLFVILFGSSGVGVFFLLNHFFAKKSDDMSSKTGQSGTAAKSSSVPNTQVASLNGKNQQDEQKQPVKDQKNNKPSSGTGKSHSEDDKAKSATGKSTDKAGPDKNGSSSSGTPDRKTPIKTDVKKSLPISRSSIADKSPTSGHGNSENSKTDDFSKLSKKELNQKMMKLGMEYNKYIQSAAAKRAISDLKTFSSCTSAVMTYIYSSDESQRAVIKPSYDVCKKKFPILIKYAKKYGGNGITMAQQKIPGISEYLRKTNEYSMNILRIQRLINAKSKKP